MLKRNQITKTPEILYTLKMALVLKRKRLPEMYLNRSGHPFKLIGNIDFSTTCNTNRGSFLKMSCEV